VYGERMQIIGIDPGFDRVGWCIGTAQGNECKILEYGAILTQKSDHIFERYASILTQFEELFQRFQPEEAAIESLFFSKNQKTALRVSEARGVILGFLIKQKVKCFEYNPLQIKQAVTGYGKADKSAMERMIRLQYHLENAKILDDVMDAIGIAVTHTAARTLIQHL
jgi:crossover junction endodeoxyribonuclease RuvC